MYRKPTGNSGTDQNHCEPSKPEREPESSGPYAVLRSRDWLLYTIARTIAALGQQITNVAIGWELYQRTHSAMALAYVGLIQFFPVLALALPAGHAADRFPRKTILQCAQLLLVLCSLGLAVASAARAPIPWIYFWLLLAGVARGFSGPARSAMLPQLLPPQHFESAIKWSTSAFQIASVSGPAIGGVVIALGHGATPAYLLDATAGTLAFGLVALAATHYATPRNKPNPITVATLTAGLRFVWETPMILATITLDLFAVLLGGAVTLLPIFAADVLRVGPGGLGLLESAPSIGACVTAFVVTHLPPLRKPGLSMLWAVAVFGLATVVFGISQNFALSWMMLLITGAADNISVVVRSTLIQLLTPEPMLGRVSAVNGVFITSSNQLGGFESGLAARFFGPVVSVVAGGLGTLLVVAAVAIHWPVIRRTHTSPREGGI